VFETICVIRIAVGKGEIVGDAEFGALVEENLGCRLGYVEEEDAVLAGDQLSSPPQATDPLVGGEMTVVRLVAQISGRRKGTVLSTRLQFPEYVEVDHRQKVRARSLLSPARMKGPLLSDGVRRRGAVRTRRLALGAPVP
jgi:hypothetical protein